MKKGISVGLFVLLAISSAASSMLHAGDIRAQTQQRVLQQRKALMVMKPTVTSVTPQKAILPQGGDPVVVEAKGANLNIINSAKAMRAGSAVAGIEVILDKSQLPTALKVSLKASGTTPIATDYQLAVFDAGNNKLLDVPTTVLAIEVVAPVQKAIVAQKTKTAIKTTQPVQRQTQTKQMTSTARPGVTSVTPQKAVLTQGGEAVTIEAKGTNLTAVGSVQVTRAGVEAQGIEEVLDRSQMPGVLKVSLKASFEAQVGRDYQLTAFDTIRRKLLDVPNAVLAIEVVVPAQTSILAKTAKTVAVKKPSYSRTIRPGQPTGLPYIASWTPSPGHINSEIKFLGRDIVADFFAARIGTTGLKITSRSSSEIRATYPPNRMQGDLIVGYGTSATEYVLQKDYLVKGDPVIQSVSPSTFSFGDTITVNGQDLDLAYPHVFYVGDPVAYGYAKISNQSTSPNGEDFVRIQKIQTSANATSTTYRVYEAYALQPGYSNPITQISPQPAALSGRFRLCGPGSNTLSVASPGSVTFKGDVDELVVTKINWMRWPDITHFIVLDQDTNQNRIHVEGRGLLPYKTKTMLGSVELTNSFSSHGQDGWIQIGLNAPSGPIVFTRDNLSTESSNLNVVPAPTFTPATLEFLGQTVQSVCNIVLNTKYSLQGWNLKPSGIDGLSYEFLLSGISPGQPSWLEFKVLNHTANLIEFRVDLTGTLPETYATTTLFGGTSSTHYTLILRAKYGTKAWTLFSRPYILKAQ